MFVAFAVGRGMSLLNGRADMAMTRKSSVVTLTMC